MYQLTKILRNISRSNLSFVVLPTRRRFSSDVPETSSQIEFQIALARNLTTLLSSTELKSLKRRLFLKIKLEKAKSLLSEQCRNYLLALEKFEVSTWQTEKRVIQVYFLIDEA